MLCFWDFSPSRKTTSLLFGALLLALKHESIGRACSGFSGFQKEDPLSHFRPLRNASILWIVHFGILV